MADSKRKGDLAELRVASDLIRQGHRVALPFGDDWDFDLVLSRDGGFERVQVKYARWDGEVVPVRCRSHSMTNGKVISVKHYTAEMIDWLAVYDETTDQCFYIPASFLGRGRSLIHLRLTPARNGQRTGVHLASDFTRLSEAPFENGASRIRTDGLRVANATL